MAGAYNKDELTKAIMAAKADGLRKLPPEVLKEVKLSMGDLEIKSERLYVKGRLYIPDDKELQLHVLRQHHDPPEQGHPGYKAMF